jgi:serine/threonine-protein kinase
VAYLLATGITLPIKILRKAMHHISLGNYAYRIRQERNDELGLMFTEYNRMAEALQNKEQDDVLIEDPTQSEMSRQTAAVQPEPLDVPDDETRIAPVKPAATDEASSDQKLVDGNGLDDATRIINRN